MGRCTPFQRNYREQLAQRYAPRPKPAQPERKPWLPMGTAPHDVIVDGDYQLHQRTFDANGNVGQPEVVLRGLEGDLEAVLRYNGEDIYSLPLTEGMNRVNMDPRRARKGDTAEVLLRGKGKANVSFTFFFQEA